MTVKMFVTDLDGTLLNKEHRISAENKKAVQEAVAAGVVVTIATGRMYESALPYAKELEVDVPIITYNGALIRSVGGRDYYSSYLEAADCQDILTYCREQDWYVQIYSDGVLYFAEETPEAEAYEAAAGIRGKAVGRDGLYELCEHAPKMLGIFRDASRTDGAVEQLQRAFAGRITAVKSDPNYIEIIRPGVNKASALHQLAELLQISPEETMAIGDSNNDLPMLKAAGHSVAMGNAGEHVQKITDYVTDTCDADGVAVAIRRYVLGTEG